MAQMVRVDRLRPHPLNETFFPGLPPNYESIVNDIRERGIQQPLVLAADGETILAGHLRWQAVRELGIGEVPAEIREDLAPDSPETVYWMVMDNICRRQLTPLQQARAVRLLKDEYGIRQGARTDLKATSDMMSKVAQEFGLSARQLNRYDRLNFLVPELQRKVESGEISALAGAELSYLPPPVQRELLKAAEDGLLETLTAAGARELRRRLARHSLKGARMLRERQSHKAYLNRLKKETPAKERIGKKIADLERELAKWIDETPLAVKAALEKVVEGESGKKRAGRSAAEQARDAAKMLAEKLRRLGREDVEKDAALAGALKDLAAALRALRIA